MGFSQMGTVRGGNTHERCDRSISIDCSRMAPKRKKSSPAGATAKVRKPNDWRAPLFYWRGATRQDAGASGTWTGTWVASEDGLPGSADFDAAPTTFNLTSSRPLTSLGDAGGAEFISGSYKLDQGDGLADFSDLSHRVHLSAQGVVGACGSTEFGKFISLGKLIAHGTHGELTLARRYIADNDPRAKLSAEQVALLAASPSEREEPWTAAVWKVAAGWKPPSLEVTPGAARADEAATRPDTTTAMDVDEAIPSFIESSFCTKVEYEEWLATRKKS